MDDDEYHSKLSSVINANNTEYITNLKNDYIQQKNENKFYNYDNAVEPVLKEVFPFFKSVISGNNTSLGSSGDNLSKKEMRISSPFYFDRIFSLSIPHYQVSNAQFRMFLAQLNRGEFISVEKL